jgi:hypothetical protein
MGRPPIGKIAMTATERSRRYRAGLATKPTPATKPEPIATKPEPVATKPAEAAIAAKDREIAQLKERIAELESQLRSAAQPAGTHALTATEYNVLLKCNSSNVVARLNDPELTQRFDEATRLLTSLKAKGYVTPTTVEQERAKRREEEERERRRQEYNAKAYAMLRKRQAAARKGQETKARKAAEHTRGHRP